MPQSVRRKPNPGKRKFGFQLIEVPLDIPLAHFSIERSAKYQGSVRMQARKAVEKFSTYMGDWYDPMFATFTYDPQNEVIEINIVPRKAENLIEPQPALQDNADQAVEPPPEP